MAKKCQFCDERLEIFKSQDQENGYFDLKFEVEGKPIYAHKFMLASVSDVFKRMISDIWNKKETIEITTNSYNDFYEFLTFVYSGNCKLNDENIFTMVDLSEFYQVKELQQKCDGYLSQKEYTKENILVFLEVKRGFLFSHDKLSNILGSIHGDIEVKVTNSVGNSICGYLQNNSAIEIIKTLKNRESDNDVYNVIYWKTECKKPSTPSLLKKRVGIEWYLIYFNDGSIGVVNNSFEIGQNNYLLAEMIAETDFKITSKCKIEIE
uniref:BTB domain-containing protein n=1 Tax=Panagrolaimus davidi TaxID=227884 RepID=A0A914PZA1_9BILA